MLKSRNRGRIGEKAWERLERKRTQSSRWKAKGNTLPSWPPSGPGLSLFCSQSPLWFISYFGFSSASFSKCNTPSKFSGKSPWGRMRVKCQQRKESYHLLSPSGSQRACFQFRRARVLPFHFPLQIPQSSFYLQLPLWCPVLKSPIPLPNAPPTFLSSTTHPSTSTLPKPFLIKSFIW